MQMPTKHKDELQTKYNNEADRLASIYQGEQTGPTKVEIKRKCTKVSPHTQAEIIREEIEQIHKFLGHVGN